MKISGINGFYTKVKVDKNKKVKKENVSFGENNTMKNVSKAAILAAGIAHLPLSVMGAYPMATTQNKNTQTYGLVERADEDINGKYNIALLLSTEGTNNKIQLRNINLKTMPVSEFYTTSKKKSVVLKPDKDLENNENGAVLYSFKEEKTLNEITEEVYSDALSNYEKESEKTAVRNKMIDEIIQANPTLAKNINGEAKSYEELGNKKLTADFAGSNVLNIPTAIAYQTYSEEVARTEFYNSSKTYTPASETASVIKESEILLSDEYGSFEELIYGTYGDDISNEAYRDIAYAIVNSPLNATEFEVVLDDTDFNELAQAGSINDLNRLLKENTSDTMIGLEMPVVTTLSSKAENVSVKGSNKNGIIYQLSPAAVNEGDNDRVIEIKSNADGILTPGEVTALKDVVQYYSSPDGKGRFATVKNGETVLNNKVNYVKEFASQIMQQVVYANLDIFTAQYEDKDGVHKYGVFDVNPGYDTKGKTIEEIITNSQINTQRMNNYSFVDENGNSKFEAGTELKLPQFNYRINTYAKLETVIQEPAAQEPEVITPTKAETPTIAPTIAPTQEEEPTTAPTPPEGTYIQGADGNYYKVTSEAEGTYIKGSDGNYYKVTSQEEGTYIKGSDGNYYKVTSQEEGTYIKGSDGNYYKVTSEEEGTYIKGSDGNYYKVTSQEEGTYIKGSDGNYYKVTSEEEGTYIKGSDGNYYKVTSEAEGTYMQDSDGNYRKVTTQLPGYYIKSTDGNYYKIVTTFAPEWTKVVNEEDGYSYTVDPTPYPAVAEDGSIFVYGETNSLGLHRGCYVTPDTIPTETEDGSVFTKGDDDNWYYVDPETVPSQSEDGSVFTKGEDGNWYYLSPDALPSQSEDSSVFTKGEDGNWYYLSPDALPSQNEDGSVFTKGEDDNWYYLSPDALPSQNEDGSVLVKGEDGNWYYISQDALPSQNEDGSVLVKDEDGNWYYISPDALPSESEDGSILIKGEDGKLYYIAKDAVPSQTEDGFVLVKGEDGTWYYADPSEIEEPTTTPTTAPTGTQEPTTSTAPSTETDEPTTTPTTAPTGTQEPTTSTAPSTETDEPTTTPTTAPTGTQEPTTSTAPSTETDEPTTTPTTAPSETQDPTTSTAPSTEIDDPTTTPTTAPSGTQDPTTSTAPSTETDEPTTAPTGTEDPTTSTAPSTETDEPTTTPTTAPTGTQEPTTTPTTTPTGTQEPTTTPTVAPTETDEPATSTKIKGADGQTYQITSGITVAEFEGVLYEIPDEYKNTNYKIVPYPNGICIDVQDSIGRETSIHIYPASTSLDDGSILFRGEDGNYYYGLPLVEITVPTDIEPTGIDKPITLPTDIIFPTDEDPTIDGILDTPTEFPSGTISGGVILPTTLPTDDITSVDIDT